MSLADDKMLKKNALQRRFNAISAVHRKLAIVRYEIALKTIPKSKITKIEKVLLFIGNYWHYFSE